MRLGITSGTYVVDIETNRLNNPDKIWCIVAQSLDDDSIHKFHGDGVHEFKDFASKNIHRWVGHNFIMFDAVWLDALLGITIDQASIIDTLILSQLFNYPREDGHSLEAWGDYFNTPKLHTDLDFSRYSDAMLERCVRDVELNTKLYRFLQHKLYRDDFAFDEAVEVEHRMAFICRGLHKDGFHFETKAAQTLASEIEEKLSKIDAELLRAFPPKARFVREVTPKLTRYGTLSKVGIPRDWIDLSSIEAGAAFSLISWEPFNPASPKQVVERLNEAGWKPVNKTKGHLEAIKKKEDLTKYLEFGWKVDEENLSTLPESAPAAAHLLAERLFLAGRFRTLKEWLGVEDNGYIHAKFNTIGTWTHRMSHNSPNLGNVAAPKSIKYKAKHIQEQAVEYGKRMRSLWTVSDPENYLVGTDADGIQLRIFAHYIDDDKFTEALISGKKDDGTDAHSLNARILGVDRDTAKTFIYAFLLGAGHAKLGDIVGGGTSAGRRCHETFIESYPGLRRLRDQQIRRDARRGFFQNLDGRIIRCDSEHLMMAGYLQGGEAAIMKKANVLWRDKLDELNIRFIQRNIVHDEFQTEVIGDKEAAMLVGAIQSECITKAGEFYDLRCPMAGTFRVGKNWYDTH